MELIFSTIIGKAIANVSIALSRMSAIDTMIIVPSRDLREIAHEFRKEMPRPVRALLRGIVGRNSSEGRLLSYLLFEQAYTGELIKLGYPALAGGVVLTTITDVIGYMSFLGLGALFLL